MVRYEIVVHIAFNHTTYWLASPQFLLQKKKRSGLVRFVARSRLTVLDWNTLCTEETLSEHKDEWVRA